VLGHVAPRRSRSRSAACIQDSAPGSPHRPSQIRRGLHRGPVAAASSTARGSRVPGRLSRLGTTTLSHHQRTSRTSRHRDRPASMKRRDRSCANESPRKKARRAAEPTTSSGPDHPVLRRLYPQVLTLRNHILLQLPKSSKNRRRRISQLGLSPTAQDDASTRDVDIKVAQLLDSTLIGCVSGAVPKNHEQEVRDRSRDIEKFTQQRSQDATGGTFKPGYFLQSEVGRVTSSQLHSLARGHASRSGG
jgi:hypothetical protein